MNYHDIAEFQYLLHRVKKLIGHRTRISIFELIPYILSAIVFVMISFMVASSSISTMSFIRLWRAQGRVVYPILLWILCTIVPLYFFISDKIYLFFNRATKVYYFNESARNFLFILSGIPKGASFYYYISYPRQDYFDNYQLQANIDYMRSEGIKVVDNGLIGRVYKYENGEEVEIANFQIQ